MTRGIGWPDPVRMRTRNCESAYYKYFIKQIRNFNIIQNPLSCLEIRLYFIKAVFED